VSGEYTVMRAAEAPDYTGEAPGAFLGYARPMGSSQLGVNVRVLAPHTEHKPPDSPDGFGHSHRTIEELYFVLEGVLAVKLGDEVLALGPRDAVLIPAGTPRAVRNVSDAEAAFLMCSVKAEDPRAESVQHEDFWD
jgi:mannose-6-phosphate isomerase-like protein (cupin superfamily)